LLHPVLSANGATRPATNGRIKCDLDAYVTAAGLAAEKASPLFRILGGRGRKQLTGERMTRRTRGA
jgi:hypothetical protein